MADEKLPNPLTDLKFVAKLLAERVAATRAVIRVAEPCDCGPHRQALQTTHEAMLEHLANALCRLNEVRAHLALAHAEAEKFSATLTLQHAGSVTTHTPPKGTN
jgi:hypothetical protein